MTRSRMKQTHIQVVVATSSGGFTEVFGDYYGIAEAQTFSALLAEKLRLA